MVEFLIDFRHNSEMGRLEKESVSLDWLVKQDKLKLKKVLSTERLFNTIQNSELADPSPYVDPPSVMLTLGLLHSKTPADARRYVQSIHAAGVVALGFGIQIEHEHIPFETIRTAKELGMGLFEIPREIAFISIMHALRDEQIRLLNNQEQQLKQMQFRLNKKAQNDGLFALIDCFGSMVKGAIAVVDQAGRVYAEYDPKNFGPVAQANKLDTYATLTKQDDKTGLYLSTHLFLGVREDAHLLILLTEDSPDRFTLELLRHCATLTSILLRQPAEISQNLMELMSLAMSLQIGLDRERNDFLKHIFFKIADAHGRVRPVVMGCHDPVIFERTISLVTRLLSKEGRIPGILRLNGYTVVFLFEGNRSLTDVKALFSEYLTAIRLQVGLPVDITSFDHQMVDSLVSQMNMLRPGECSTPHDPRFIWLLTPQILEKLTENWTNLFGRLDQHDRQHNTNLTQILTVYAQHGGAITPVAKEFGLHRQTVNTRLQEIQKICEIDLNNPQIVAQLVLLNAGIDLWPTGKNNQSRS